jgi:hypothetical protein
MSACENLKPDYDPVAARTARLQLHRVNWKAKTIRGGQNSAIADALYNDADAKYSRYRELPVDRLMIEASKQGLTNNEIAALIDRNPKTVRNTLRQPWARKNLIESMKEAGNDGLKELLRSAAMKSLVVIQDMAENKSGKIKPEVQLKAATDLADRWLGRAAQPLDHTISSNKPLEQMTDEELMRIAGEPVKQAALGDASESEKPERNVNEKPSEQRTNVIELEREYQ